MIPSTAEKRRAVDSIENIPGNLSAAHAIIHINSHRAHPYASRMVDVVVDDPISPVRVVPSRIDGSYITRL
ncbi:hypothetical protein SDC9_167911 [bioreactor metagenome]|uniref:Uncharacterized protein n=1 Tax=bioreactor metagenome TaxID=1076179 RepID=A0A645G3L1_9ZZZZ